MTRDDREFAEILGWRHATRMGGVAIPRHAWLRETGRREGWGVYKKSLQTTWDSMSPEQKKASALCAS